MLKFSIDIDSSDCKELYRFIKNEKNEKFDTGLHLFYRFISAISGIILTGIVFHFFENKIDEYCSSIIFTLLFLFIIIFLIIFYLFEFKKRKIFITCNHIIGKNDFLITKNIVRVKINNNIIILNIATLYKICLDDVYIYLFLDKNTSIIINRNKISDREIARELYTILK